MNNTPKILFLMRIETGRPDNLTAKFAFQMHGAREAGCQAMCICLENGRMYLTDIGKKRPLRKNRLSKTPGYAHTALYWDLMSAGKKAMREEKPDIVYLRYKPLSPNARSLARLAKKMGIKLVVEIPTYPSELEPDHRPLRRAALRFVERLLRSISPMVDLFTVIGAPCHGTHLGRPAMNISNGVEPELLPERTVKTDPDKVRLMLLGSISRYMAYERLVRGMAEDKKSSERVELRFVGDDVDGAGAALEALGREHGLKMIFHGPLYGDELTAIFDICDVGVGSLGPYLKGLNSASPLKVREYAGRGLPLLYAGEDELLQTPARFLKRVSNDDTPIAIAPIVSFAMALKGDKGIPGEMREYAKEHMSWASQWRAILERLGAHDG